MKKFLSLVLALVMTMSLVTISAGAKDFTDDSKITYDEAIAVMSEVKVIDGYADGSFNPTATLTRGAAAKIICNLILGPTTASALSADAAPYSDVPANSTFAGYIAYCAKAGIISGYADGTFKPGNTLTGYAFMKMLLGALGYDKSVEGYEGTNWSINVAKQALGIGLDAGLLEDFDGTKPVTREEACLYALNTLKATMVEYDAKTSISVGGAEVTIAGSKAQDVKQGTYKSFTNDPADVTLEFCEKYFSNLKLAETADDFGRPSNTWKIKNTEIGTFANKADLVETFTKKVTKAKMYETVGKSVYDALCDNDAKLSVWFDGVETKVAAANIDSYIEKNNSGKINSTGNGDVTEVYVDSDSNVTVVTTRTYLFQAAADYDSKKESVSLTTDATKYDTAITLSSKTLDADDFPAIKDFKADDYILVTAVKNAAGKYDVKSVEKAETVTEEITGYKYDSDVTTATKTYDYAASASTIKTTGYNVGHPATLVLDKNGYVIGVDEAVVLSDYVYIEAFGSTSSLSAKAVAKAIFPDGTSAEIAVKEAYDKKTPANGQVKNQSTIAGWRLDITNHDGWYTFSKNSSGEYTLYNIETSKYTEEIAEFTRGGSNLQITDNGKVDAIIATDATDKHDADDTLFNDDTVVILKDKNGDLTVYTGVKNVPTITLTGSSGDKASVTVVEKKSNGYATLVYIDVPVTATISGGKAANLVYVISYDGKYVTTDNEVSYKYTVLEGEEEVKVEADTQIQSQIGNVYQVANSLTKNSKDQLTDFNLVGGPDGGVVIGGTGVVSSTSGKAIAQSAGTLTIDGTKYLVAEDAKITLLTMGKVKNSAGSYISDARVLNKDKDASYEVAVDISAKELVDDLKGYTYTYDYAGKVSETSGNVITELYVTIKYASDANADVAEIGTITVAPSTTSAGYDTIAEAVNNAITVADGTSMTVSATGTGTMTYKVAWSADEDTTDDDITTTPPASGWTYVAASGIYVVKVAVKSADETASDVKYVAVKPVTYYTLKVTNNDLSAAIMVTYNGQDYVVAKAASGSAPTVVTLDTKLVKDDVITVKYVVEDSGSIGAVTCTGAASSTLFNKTFNITVGTSNIDIAVADA